MAGGCVCSWDAYGESWLLRDSVSPLYQGLLGYPALGAEHPPHYPAADGGPGAGSTWSAGL